MKWALRMGRSYPPPTPNPELSTQHFILGSFVGSRCLFGCLKKLGKLPLYTKWDQKPRYTKWEFVPPYTRNWTRLPRTRIRVASPRYTKLDCQIRVNVTGFRQRAPRGCDLHTRNATKKTPGLSIRARSALMTIPTDRSERGVRGASEDQF